MINHLFHTSRSSGSARTSQARTGLSAGYNGPYGSRLEENLVSYLRGQTLGPSDAPPTLDTAPDTTLDAASVEIPDRPHLTVGDVLGMADGLGLVDPVTDDNARTVAGRSSIAFVQLPKTEAEKSRLDDWMAKRPSHIPVAVWQAMEPALPGLWDMPGWGRLPLGMRLEMENALATPQGRAGLRRAAQAEIEAWISTGRSARHSSPRWTGRCRWKRTRRAGRV